MGSTFWRPALLGAMLVLALGAGTAGAGEPQKGAPGKGLVARSAGAAGAEFVPGRLLVQFRAGVSAAARTSALAARGARATARLGAPGLTLVKLPQGASVRASAAALARDPRVLYAEPDYLYELSQVVPNDPLFSQLWGLSQGNDADIDAPEAWNTQTGHEDIVVAVIDSGVAYDHPDLAGNIWANTDEIAGNGLDDDGNDLVDDVRGWDFVDEENEPLDRNGHGTHVAGTIGAVGNNLDGVAGVNWDVSLMPLRAANGKGSLAASNILDAVRYACQNGAHIVNGSFGGPGKSQTLGNTLKSADCKDTLFVFAAGNDGTNLNNNTQATNAYPCEYHRPAPHGFGVPNLICVAATTHNDGLSSFSNRGTSAVHLGAPGGNANGTDILSTWPGYSTVWGPDDMETAGTWGDPINIQGGTQVPPNWDRTSAASSSGTWSLTDSPAGNYVNNALTTIRNMTVIDLSDRIGCLIEYDLRLDVEGGFDWFGIFGGTTTLADDEEVDAWSGSSGGAFFTLESNLTSFDGESEVYVRFFLDSDPSVRHDGAYVDDVLVKCVAPNGEDYLAIPGTSMASPHVAGAAALLLAETPAMSPAKLKNAILQGVDKKASLRDRVSTGGRLNVDKSLTIAMDVTPPNTTITGRPPNRTRDTKATFRFTSNESGSRFQCRHMSGSWQSCSSPKVYKNLQPGRHTFEVRAIDKNGNRDQTPATDSWRVRR